MSKNVSGNINISGNGLLHLSPKQRSWKRFKANKRGYYSLIIFTTLFVLSLFAEVLSNDKPLMVSFEQSYYFPVFTRLLYK